MPKVVTENVKHRPINLPLLDPPLILRQLICPYSNTRRSFVFILSAPLLSPSYIVPSAFYLCWIWQLLNPGLHLTNLDKQFQKCGFYDCDPVPFSSFAYPPPCWESIAYIHIGYCCFPVRLWDRNKPKTHMDEQQEERTSFVCVVILRWSHSQASIQTENDVFYRTHTAS